MKRLVSFARNLSISWKFILVYFTIFVIQIILTSIYLYIQSSNSVIKQATLVMEQNLQQTKESIEQKENVIENLSKIFPVDKTIQTFLDYNYQNEVEKLHDYQFNISPIIENVLRQNNTINSIRFYMPHLITTERIDSYYSVSVSREPKLFYDMLKQRPEQAGWISTQRAMVYQESSSRYINEQFFAYNYKIISQRNYGEVASFEVFIKEEVLFDMLRDPIVNKFGSVFVVDNRNKIVSNNIPEIFNKDVSSTGLYNYVNDEKMKKVETINNKKSIVITMPIDGINCSIVGIFPISNFNSEIKSSIGNILVFFVLSFSIIGLIIFAVTNVLLSRVKKLVKAMKQVGDGNLSVSVEVSSQDEFGELALNFNKMTKRIHELVETVYKIQIMEREAELKALEAQINPHFLYNTLATISWAARKIKSKEIEKISNSLAKFYRLVLNKGGTLISVKDEVDMVKAYLNIQKVRFDDMFDVVYQIDEGVYEYEIVKNILQPIVENALSHGIEAKRGHGTIIIKVGELSDRLYLSIIDDGVGISKDKLKDILRGNVGRTSGSGYAIQNIIRRLKTYYGENQTFEIYSRVGIGTVITITCKKFYH